MQKCFWYVIFTGLMMIYDEWAPHRPIILPQEEQINQTWCLLYCQTDMHIEKMWLGPENASLNNPFSRLAKQACITKIRRTDGQR